MAAAVRGGNVWDFREGKKWKVEKVRVMYLTYDL